MDKPKLSNNFKSLLHAFMYSYIIIILLSLVYHYLNFSKEQFFKFESLFIPIILPFLSIYAVFKYPASLVVFSILIFLILFLYKKNVNKKGKVILLTMIFISWDLLSFYLFRMIASAY
ncbi:hypothetical protein [Psychrobacter celer]|uniref:hypothetical protein n=1 Tax=Psychrobacter celer TaxID=306572 RepID=UPI003FD6A94C